MKVRLWCVINDKEEHLLVDLSVNKINYIGYVLEWDENKELYKDQYGQWGYRTLPSSLIESRMSCHKNETEVFEEFKQIKQQLYNEGVFQ